MSLQRQDTVVQCRDVLLSAIQPPARCLDRYVSLNRGRPGQGRHTNHFSIFQPVYPWGPGASPREARKMGKLQFVMQRAPGTRSRSVLRRKNIVCQNQQQHHQPTSRNEANISSRTPDSGAKSCDKPLALPSEDNLVKMMSFMRNLVSSMSPQRRNYLTPASKHHHGVGFQFPVQATDNSTSISAAVSQREPRKAVRSVPRRAVVYQSPGTNHAKIKLRTEAMDSSHQDHTSQVSFDPRDVHHASNSSAMNTSSKSKDSSRCAPAVCHSGQSSDRHNNKKAHNMTSVLALSGLLTEDERATALGENRAGKGTPVITATASKSRMSQTPARLSKKSTKLGYNSVATLGSSDSRQKCEPVPITLQERLCRLHDTDADVDVDIKGLRRDLHVRDEESVFLFPALKSGAMDEPLRFACRDVMFAIPSINY